MIDLSLDIGNLLRSELLTGFAVFLRVSAFVSLLPTLGERTVPTRTKLLIAVCLTFLIAPAVHSNIAMPLPNMLIMTEIVTGLIFGLGFRLFVLALQTAGSIAAQATSLSQLLGGNAADPMPAMGHVLVISGLALFVITGLHIRTIQFFVLLYNIVPIGEFPNPAAFSEWGVARISTSFSLAFSLAAPFLIVSAIYNLAIGAINRAMPQLMVAFVGAPLITAGGLIMLFLVAPTMLIAWTQAITELLSFPGEALR